MEGNPGTPIATRTSRARRRETERELRAVAESHGWDLTGIDIFELPSTYTKPEEQYTVFHASEVELTYRRFGRVEHYPLRFCFLHQEMRCATAARSLRSNTFSPAGIARCCCSKTAPRRSATWTWPASRTA